MRSESMKAAHSTMTMICGKAEFITRSQGVKEWWIAIISESGMAISRVQLWARCFTVFCSSSEMHHLWAKNMGLRDGRTDGQTSASLKSHAVPHFGGGHNKFCNLRGWSSSGNKMSCERLNRNQVTEICRSGAWLWVFFAFTKLDLDVTT